MKNSNSPTRLFDLLNGRHMRKERTRSNQLAHALLHRGIQRGETVAIITGSRNHWPLTTAISQTGAVPLVLEPNLTAEQYLELLRDTRIVFVENKTILEHFRLIAPQVEHLRLLITLEPVDGELTLDTLLDEGRHHVDEEKLHRRTSLITTDEVCIYQYRGGVNRTPLSHKMVLQTLLAC